MEECFRRLSDRQLANLAYHVEMGTPILCGKLSSFYTDGLGGAWPAVLASTREVPSEVMEANNLGAAEEWKDVIAQLGGYKYMDALTTATEEGIRAAILNAAKDSPTAWFGAAPAAYRPNSME